MRATKTLHGSGSKGHPSTPPPPPKLDKGAARNAAQQRAHRYVRRNRNLDTHSFAGCTRRGRQRVVCRFAARGRSQTTTTSCRFRVVVRGRGFQASARLQRPSCRTSLRAILSAAEARRAMLATAREIARPAKVTVSNLDMIGPRAWSGIAEWTVATADGYIEICSVELIAEQPESEPVAVRTRNHLCI